MLPLPTCRSIVEGHATCDVHVMRSLPLLRVFPFGASTGKRAILSTSAAEEAVKALGEEDELMLLNALKLVASIAVHPGENNCVQACSMYSMYVCLSVSVCLSISKYLCMMYLA